MEPGPQVDSDDDGKDGPPHPVIISEAVKDTFALVLFSPGDKSDDYLLMYLLGNLSHVGPLTWALDLGLSF